jgi:outer membrane protein
MIKNRIILIALAGAVGLHAQQQLTLEQCLTLARAKNLELRNASITLQSGKYSEQEIIASQRPQIKAAGSAGYAPHSPQIGYDPAITNGGQVSVQVTLQTPLYSWGMRELRLKRGTVDQKQHGAQLARTERDVTASVKQLFIENLRGCEEVLLRIEAITRLSDYLDRVQLQYKGGSAGYSDILKTKTQISSAKEMLRKSQETVTLSKISLAELLGMTPDTAFHLSGNIDTMLLGVREANYSFDTAKIPELTAAHEEVEKGLIDLELIKRERFPIISLTMDGGYLSSVDRLNSSDSKNAMGFSTGAAFEVPLMDWGALRYRRLQQQLAIDTLNITAQIISRSFTAEFNRTTLQLNNARVQLGLIRERIKNAGEDFLLAKSKYVAGASTSSDVLLAQQTLTDAKIDELQTKATIVILAARRDQISSPTR